MSELASEMLEGRARWPDRVAARFHLLMCRFCREYFLQLRMTIGAMRAVQPPEVPVDPEKVLDDIERASRR